MSIKKTYSAAPREQRPDKKAEYHLIATRDDAEDLGHICACVSHKTLDPEQMGKLELIRLDPHLWSVFVDSYRSIVSEFKRAECEENDHDDHHHHGHHNHPVAVVHELHH